MCNPCSRSVCYRCPRFIPITPSAFCLLITDHFLHFPHFSPFSSTAHCSLLALPPTFSSPSDAIPLACQVIIPDSMRFLLQPLFHQRLVPPKPPGGGGSMLDVRLVRRSLGEVGCSMFTSPPLRMQRHPNATGRRPQGGAHSDAPMPAVRSGKRATPPARSLRFCQDLHPISADPISGTSSLPA